MATRRKRNLNFLPAESRTEPVIDISAYPVDIGVGELMRLTRERLGHELQTVANQLRIRLSYLEAIEDARFRDLPGTTYAVGFVRSYADYLGLDGADIVRRFREEAARIHGQTKLVFPALTAEGKLPRAAVLLVSAVGLAAVYGVWYYISSHQHSDLPVITDVPDRLVVAPDSGPGADAAAPDRSPEISAPTPAEPPADHTAGAGTGAANAASSPPSDSPAPDGAASNSPASDSPALDSQARAPAGDRTDISTASPAAPSVAAPPAPTAATAPSTGASPAPPAPIAETGVPPPAVTSVGQPGATAPVAPFDAAAGSTAPSPAAPAPPAAPDATTGSTAPVPAAPTALAAPTAPAAPAPPVAPDVAANGIPAAPALPAITGQDGTQQALAPAEAVKGVVLEARMDSWIKVVDAKGKTVTNQVLKAGQRYVVPDQPGLILRTGNAGGLDVLVDGRKAPPLGDVGTVLTKVTLEPGRLLDGTAVAD